MATQSYLLAWTLASIVSAQASPSLSSPIAPTVPVTAAYRLPSDLLQVRQLYDCADFIAVGEFESKREPFLRLGGGTSAVQVAIYRLNSMVKGPLRAKMLPVHHLTDDSPYAEGDRKIGFELDRKVFVPGLKVLLFLRGRCSEPRNFEGSPQRTYEEALRWGSLKLSRGYEIGFYTISSSRGVYLWTPDAEERIRKAVKEVQPQGRPNDCCPFSRPGEFGPPCPPEVFEGK